MKKRLPRKQLPGKTAPKPTTAKTGEHCPVIGWWAPSGRQGDKNFVAEGSIMPADKGQSVTWTLVANEARSREPKPQAQAKQGSAIRKAAPWETMQIGRI
jgi:hypothetical protein